LANNEQPISTGEILSGAFFGEPMRVLTLTAVNAETRELRLVGIQTRILQTVPLSQSEIQSLDREKSGSRSHKRALLRFDGGSEE
jgi:hypothetical protein